MPRYWVTVERRVRLTTRFEIDSVDEASARAEALRLGEEELPGASPGAEKVEVVASAELVPEDTP